MLSEEREKFGWELYPYPIVSIFQKALHADDPIARFIQFGHLFEVLLRYFSTIALGLFFHERKEIPSMQRMFATLERPSLGHWCEILRTLPKKLEKAQALTMPEINSLYAREKQSSEMREAYRTLQYFLGKKKEKPPKNFSISTFFELLVAFRNKTKGHGAIQAEFAGQLNPFLENSLRYVLEMTQFLSLYPLAVATSDDDPDLKKLMGDGGNGIPAESSVFLCNQQGAPWLSLSPMVLWQDTKFWFINGWKPNKEVEYLCYDTGEMHLTAFSNIAHIVEQALTLHTELARNVKIEVSTEKAYDLPLDGAVIAQDTNRVFGPLQPIEIDMDQDLKQEMKKVIDVLKFEFEPNKMGEVIVSKRSWCKSRYLLEAIIYNLDHSEITSEKVIREAFDGCLHKVAELGLSTVVMNPLGTEYQKISELSFVKTLKDTYDKYRTDLCNLTKIVLVPREEKQIDSLVAAVEKVIGIKPQRRY